MRSTLRFPPLALSAALLTAGALLHCAASSAPSAPCDNATCASSASGGSNPTGVDGADGGVTLGSPGSSGGTTGTTSSANSDGGASQTNGGGAANPPSSEGGAPVEITGPLPRLVAYVNVTCGFGVGTNGGECLASPDPTVNYVKQWEDDKSSPITHYVLSFLSFQGASIQTDPGEIWKTGGSTTDFTLIDGVREALVSAQVHGKKVMLSVGGAAGSTGFLAWWSGLGADSPARVAAMSAEIQRVTVAFATANGVHADGIDIDIELGGIYAAGSDKYVSTRDLIDAIPDSLLAAFVPQVGNGLCAAPNVGDPLPRRRRSEASARSR